MAACGRRPHHPRHVGVDPTRLMAVLVWVSMATALWHFAIFVPDRFHGGLIGAFLFANGGAVLVGVVAEGFALPALSVVSVVDVISGGLGGAAGLMAAYVYGARSGAPP
jgi:hypothetical protein